MKGNSQEEIEDLVLAIYRQHKGSVPATMASLKALGISLSGFNVFAYASKSVLRKKEAPFPAPVDVIGEIGLGPPQICQVGLDMLSEEEVAESFAIIREADLARPEKEVSGEDASFLAPSRV